MTTVPQNPPPAGTPAPATAPWVVATLSVLAAVVGVALCAGVAVLVWVRPGAMGPLTAGLSTAGFLVGMAALLVAVLVAARR
ncbi:hypothetical protein OG596_37810 [Streptomyces sp. NBC_01102]|uniref:hypothetical protein n=1 Tax=unclassified Streptomyces TaxID=2593676 RepID=UPI0038664535|nr:hypothetical protein OG596_00110 [Streptomyces sp. NBC_01102]WSU70712.1 hypothetical protein OG596_37810 [Streptomyces sp. NBC_01102]